MESNVNNAFKKKQEMLEKFSGKEEATEKKVDEFKKLSFNVKLSTHEKFKQYCKEEGFKMSAQIEKLMLQKLERIGY